MTGSNHSSRRLSYMSYSEEGGDGSAHVCRSSGVPSSQEGTLFARTYVSNHYLYGVGVYVAEGDAVVDGLGLAVGLAVEVALGLADGDGVSEKLVADIFQTWALLNSACVGIL